MCPPLQVIKHPIHTNVGSDNHVITFLGKNNFGLIYKGQRELWGNMRADREWEASSAIIPTISGDSFFGLSIVPSTELTCSVHTH
jgi:hypothetical protein